MNINYPKISIGLVVYNGVDYIRNALDSIVKQSYENIELVVVGGGSTDGTVEIIRKYRDKLAYWHSEPDRGLAHAFNLVVEYSSGQCLMRHLTEEEL